MVFYLMLLFAHQISAKRGGGDQSHSRGMRFLFCYCQGYMYTVRFVAQTTFYAPGTQSSQSANDWRVESSGTCFCQEEEVQMSLFAQAQRQVQKTVPKRGYDVTDRIDYPCSSIRYERKGTISGRQIRSNSPCH
jgi:hypothetical protein